MQPFSEKVDVGGGGGGKGVVCPLRKDIGRKEEGGGKVKEGSYVTISDRSYIMEGSLSEVGKSPPHDSYIPQRLVSSNTHTQLCNPIYIGNTQNALKK